MPRPPAQPPDDRDAAGDPGDGEGPAIGNVLGFSLLFRERKALLALSRRGLAPGVRVRDYEAEIPNVSFPLKGALQASRFKHRRCRAVSATVIVERRAIEPYLQRQLVGTRLAGIRIDQVHVELRADLPGATAPRPVLGLGGRGPDGGVVWFQVAFGIEPEGRHLRLHPSHRWLIGDLSMPRAHPQDAPSSGVDALWRTLLPRLRDVCTPQPDGTVLVDVARLTLTPSFVRTGWKAPDLGDLGVETVALGRRSITVELRLASPEPAMAVEMDVSDPVGDMLARLHARRRDPAALDDVLEMVDHLIAQLDPGAPSRLACARWAVQLSRHHNRAACLESLRAWLDMRPTDAEARRLLVLTLGRAGLDRELARLLVTDRRAISDEPGADLRRAHLDLALAAILVDRLDEPRSALSILRPLVTGLREVGAGDPRRPLLPGALVLLARARIADAAAAGAHAGHAQQPLDEALELVTEAGAPASRRADMRAAVARTFSRCGELRSALSLMGRALTEDPTHDEHLDLAIELSLAVGERASAVDLLRIRLDGAPLDERPTLRRRLLGILADVDDPEYLPLTREEVERALDLDPDAADVLRLAADVEARAGHPAAAADHLARLSELALDDDSRVDIELERARRLEDARLLDGAWEALRTVLSLLDTMASGATNVEAEPDPRLRPTLELAMELAPPTKRPELLDRFIEVARGPALGRALVERAEAQIRHEDRVADLLAAARHTDDPTPVLERLETACTDDPDGLAAMLEIAEAAQLAKVASRGLERLGDLAMRAGDASRARPLFERALGHLTERDDGAPRARVAGRLADALEAEGRPDAALDVLRRLPHDGAADPVQRDRRIAALASALGGDSLALEHLSRARAELVRRGDAPAALDEVSDELFAALYRLGETERAESLATQMLTQSDAGRRAHWLSQAASVSDGPDRLERLYEASRLAPRDDDVADALEAELRARGDRPALIERLHARLDRADSPDARAAILERLIATLEPSDQIDELDTGEAASPEAELSAAGVELGHVSDLYAELLSLRPDHIGGLLALARRRQADGAEQEALMLWRRAASLLDPGDPRLLVPALALGRRALRDEVLDDAESWLRHALSVQADQPEALAGLREIGLARRDPRAVLDAVDGLLRRATSRTARAELEFEAARAHLQLEEGHLAFDRLRRAAAETEPRGDLHLEIAQVWLEQARRRQQPGEEAQARAQLRRALGTDLPSAQLLDEIRLLADELDALDEALDLVELALVRHGAGGTALALLERLTGAPDLWQRRLELLRGAIDQLSDVAARDRVAELMLSTARQVEAPAVALLALDRMSAALAETDAHLEARRWAITSLGRTREERAELEARLSDPETPVSPSLVTRFRDCFRADEGEHDLPDEPERAASLAAAERLIELSAAAQPDRAARLAEVAFGLAEDSGQVLPPALALEGLARLARRGEIARARWRAVEDAVFEEARPDRIARLSELAAAAHVAGVDHLAGRSSGILERGLQLRPAATPLHALLIDRVRRTAGDEPESFLETLRVRLDELARRRELAATDRADLFIAAAGQLDEPLAVRHLEARARLELDDAAAFEALVGELERRRAWEAVVGLRLAQTPEPSDDPDRWIALALRARADTPNAEGRARARAGTLLLDAGALEAGIEHLGRALELGAGSPRTRVRYGEALAELRRPAEALEALAPLLEEHANVPDVDVPALLARCGELAHDLGALERAATLLTRARRQSPDRPDLRTEVSVRLFDVLVALGRHRDAARLAEATAEEHFTDLEAAADWLEKASDVLGEGRDPAEVLRLLRRRLELTPADPALLDALEAALEQAGDVPALIELLRRRLDAVVSLEANADPPAQPPLLDGLDLRRAARLAWLLESRPELSSEPDVVRTRFDLLAAVAHTLRETDATVVEFGDDDTPPLDEIGARLRLARLRDGQGRTDEAAALRRALLEDHPDDRRLGAAARALLDWAVEHDDLALAGGLAHRCLDLHDRDAKLLAIALDVGRRNDDAALVQRGARGLLTSRHADDASEADIDSAQRAALWLELAEAERTLGDDAAALEAFERGAAEASPEGAQHRRIVERWLTLLERLDDQTHRPSEARARAHLRVALGAELPRADRIAEIDLLLEGLGRVEPAIALLVEALAAAPPDDELRSRLRRAASRSEATDRYPRALREVLDRLAETGDVDLDLDARDDLLMELARAARQMEGARTALRAVDELGPEAAGATEMLDLRDWAVRKLGRVDDEIASIEARLLLAPPDPLAVTRLWRTLESDAERTATRLLALHRDAPGAVSVWLCQRAVSVLLDRAPHAHEALVATLEAAAAALERHDPDDPHDPDQADTSEPRVERFDANLRDDWHRVAAALGAPEVPALEARLAAVARRIPDLATARSERLGPALARNPEDLELVREALAAFDDPESLETWLDELALELDDDPRAAPIPTAIRWRLTLTRVVDESAACEVLARASAAMPLHAPPPAHTALLDRALALRAHGVAAQLLYAQDAAAADDPARAALTADAQANAWRKLADALAADPDARPADELRARLEVARHSTDAGDAVAALERALELDDSDRVRMRLVDLHAERGAPGAALDVLEPLLHREAIALELAVRAGDLALAAGTPERAVAPWRRAITSGEFADVTRPSLGERLFDLLASDLDRPDEALALALERAAAPDTADADAAAWLWRAAALPSPVLEADGRGEVELLREAVTRDPGRPGLAEAHEAALERAGDHQGLVQALARALDGPGPAPEAPTDAASRDRRLRRWLELTADAPAPERRRAREVAHRRWPDDGALALALADLRAVTEDLDGALDLWTRHVDDAPDGPELTPALQALASQAWDRGALETARERWTRALRCDPAATAPWLGLRKIAARTDDAPLALKVAEALLETGVGPETHRAETDPGDESTRPTRLELQRERAAALERLERPVDAAAALAAAAELAATGSELQVSLCERWLTLVADLEPDDRHDARELATLEAQARAALRVALGERLPAAALRAEARLLAGELDAADEALLIVRERILESPDRASLLEVLADLADDLAARGLEVTYLDELTRLVEDATTPGVARRLAEHLALASRERGEPEVALAALEQLDEAQAGAPRMVELREWAVRRAGRTEEERARLHDAMCEAPVGERLTALVDQLMRMYDGDSEPWARSMVDVATRRRDGGALALVLRVGQHADERGGVPLGTRLDAVACALELGANDRIHRLLASVHRDLLDENRPDTIRRALSIFDAHGMTEPDPAGDPRVDALTEALWAHDAADLTAHRVARRRRGSDAAYHAAIEDYVSAQAVRGGNLARLWIGASELADDPDRGRYILASALERVASDAAASTTLLRHFEQLGAWTDAVDGWLSRPGRATRDDLERLLDATAHAPELHARVAAALADMVVEADPAFAAELWTLALDLGALAPEPLAELRHRLGLAYAEAGRAEAALEYLLPLVETTDADADGANAPLDPRARRALTLRVARLLEGAGRSQRAMSLAEGLWAVDALEEDLRRGLPPLMWSLRRASRSGDAAIVDDDDIDIDAHVAAYTLAARRAQGPERVAWLRRAAILAGPSARVPLLKEAVRLAPDDPELAELFAGALSEAGERRELESVLRRRLDRELVARSAADEGGDATARALETARRLLDLVDQDRRVGEAVALFEIILKLDPRDIDAWARLGDLRLAAGDRRGAEESWQEVVELADDDDDRVFDPALSLADAAAARGDEEAAFAMVARALESRPKDRGALEVRLALGERFERADVVIAAVDDLLEYAAVDPDGPVDTVRLEWARATALDRLGDDGAQRAWSRAAVAAREAPLETRLALTQAWIARAAQREGAHAAHDEAEARAALREARASVDGGLSAADLAEVEPEIRAELDLLLGPLVSPGEAVEVLEQWLAAHPHGSTLLGWLKEASGAADGGLRHIEALERALATASSDDTARRDGFAEELAYAAVELVDPERLLQAMDALSGARAASPEMLDLREWAVRQLGRVDDELGKIDAALADEVELDAIVPRLVRMLDGDRHAAAERLFDVARRHEGPRRAALLERVLELATTSTGSDDDQDRGMRLAIEALEFGASGEEPSFDALRALEVIEQAAFSADDPAQLANLVQATLASDDAADGALARRGEEILGLAFLRYPDAWALHRVVLRDTAPTEAQLREAITRLAAVAERSSIRGHTAARLWAGFAGLLDRPSAARLLAERAEQALRDDPDAFSGLLDALQDRKHWPDVMRLLELRMAATEVMAHKVDALKQLAHIRADILGDQVTAIRQLEQALEFAPRDPDLLLPLLDHHFGQRDLGPAIDLSVQVLEHVPMGDMAFTALGHRAADAALARGEHERAESLLERVLERVPDDERTQKRLDELRAMADDAQHRVRMLGAIATRQTGSARLDALEERARLLVTVDRPDEAIADLEAVIAESPDRRASVQLLDELYIRRERWSDLVGLLERDYPRHAGLARARVLERAANLYAERLFDNSRAEQALRLALEQLGAPPPESVEREAVDRLYLQMTRCLELQGRYEELAQMLEAELAAELGPEGGAPTDSRVELMIELARILRDYVEDEARAARVYERLEGLGHLPEDGLATLARWYRAQHRHEDLVRVLIVRAKALGREGDTERKAELDRRIGELLDGPLRRPHEAARYFLDAYLANPEDNPGAGSRARVLLAGTDSVVNVRQAVLDRLPDLDDRQRAFGLVLLAELLAPQESFELEAEHRFEEALDIDPELGPALDGIGRLRARQGRLDDAAAPLVAAARSPGLDAERAADTAAVAARALLELHRPHDAEAVLEHALERHPGGQRALLELARLYSRTGRSEDEARALDRLSSLSLSSMLRAEVAYRRAMLLEPEFSRDPFCESGEQARAYLLEAVGADAMHAQARQVLLDLASARSEWSIVAHMYFLTVRELPPGPSRALTHLDLAEVYLERLHDADSATRNLASALSQPTTDLVVRKRANLIAGNLPEPDKAASYLVRAATEETELDDGGRARLLITAAELHLRGDDPEAGEQALTRARALPEISEAALSAVERVQELLGAEDFELKKQRSALLKLLETEDHNVERLHILSRLGEIGRALPDPALLESSSRQLIELAHGMLGRPAERESAVLALRDLFAERGDFGRLVSLYEELAGSARDEKQAADMLVDAARFAWTGVRDGKLAVAIVGRALQRVPTHPLAIALLGDMSAAEDLSTERAMLDELSRLDPARLDPRLVARLAAIARRLGRSEHAISVLQALLERDLSPAVEGDVLAQLDRLLEERGDAQTRLDVLTRRVQLARQHSPDRGPDLALELARAQASSGALDAARSTCAEALDERPSDTALSELYAELLERSEDWPNLARILEHLGAIHIEPDRKASWFTRAARVHLDHDESPQEAMASARRLLTRAREVSERYAPARATMIPLAFAEQRWDEVLELSIELRTLGGDEDEALLFGAVTEALVHGRRTIARSIGPRHDASIRAKLLWPAVARVSEVLATEGPLPRLDAVLAATAALTGTTEDVREELHAWTAGRAPRPGTALILARINEACDRREAGHFLYQLSACLAPDGPVPALVERLPATGLADDPLHDARSVPLAWRGATREVLIALREFLAGIRGTGGEETYPRHALERSAVQTAGRLVAEMREPLGMTIPVRITDDPLYAGVGIRNRPEPMVVVNEELMGLPDAERAFRMAMAAAAIASGLAMVTDTHPLGIGDLLDAIAHFADPDVVLESSGARFIADALNARGLRASEFDPELRATLSAELKHWRTDDRALEQLVSTIRRAIMLLATRLCGRLDGAILTLARDQGVLIEGEYPDARRAIRSDDAQWLLRELDLTHA